MELFPKANRNATKAGPGAFRDALIAAAVVSAAGWVTRKTQNPELGQAAGEAAGQVVSQGIGLLTVAVASVLTGATTFLRKKRAEATS